MEMYRPALSLYQQVLKINNEYSKIYADIGTCFDKLGKQTDAKRFYRKFLSSQPNDESASSILRRVEKLKSAKNSHLKLLNI